MSGPPPMLGQGFSPVMPTGEVVLNGRRDTAEYESRGFGEDLEGNLKHIAHIDYREPVFTRRGRQPDKAQDFAPGEYAIDVFVAFNGCQHEADELFEMVGVSRAPPMHQGMAGRETMESGFAIQRGGGLSLFMNTRADIPVGAYLGWKIPRADGLPPDPCKRGRILAEIYEWNTSQAMLEAPLLHRSIRDQMSGKLDLSAMHISQRAPHTNAWKIFESFLAIAFDSVVVYLENTQAAVLSDNEKLEVAEMFGLVEIQSSDANAEAKSETMAKISNKLLDTILQVETDEASGNSIPTSNTLAFQLFADGVYNTNGRQKTVSAKQAAGYETLFDTMLNMWDINDQKKFAWTNSGAARARDADVVLRRV